ncbi:hypothetical protein B296_00003318 [Ensete ventricosum]|uniref:Uncharacterized protein n=1 Tax=Ensete ventricosum TaxID=4639 RepID=A0A427B5Q0_ENSVE|nr:hypothetical protein B296_00003318 [Ensete ventricosum]
MSHVQCSTLPGKKPLLPNRPPETRGQPTFPLLREGSMPTHTLGCYWWFLNDLGLPPSVCNPSLSVVSLEAFLGLTHQVQALAEMIQSIIPHIPQLMQQPTPQQQTSSTTPLEPPPSQGQPLVQWRPNDEVAQLLPELLSGPPRNATDQSVPTTNAPTHNMLKPDTSPLTRQTRSGHSCD